MKNQDLKHHQQQSNSSNTTKQKPNSTQQQTMRNKQPQDQNQIAADPIEELNKEIQRELKRRGDTAVHQAVLENDVHQLKELLKRGMPVFNPSDADGGTPLHRAAEACAIECAKVLLEKNADIDAQNAMGQTPFHVCAEKQDFIFGKFLLKNRARRNCRPGCLKCRLFIKQIERYDKNQRDLEQHLQEQKLEEEKVKDQKKKERKKNKNLIKDGSKAPEIDLLKEIQKIRDEVGGPFFNKRENQKFKEQQEQIRQEEELRQQQLRTRESQRVFNKSNQTLPKISEIIDIPHLTELLSNMIIDIDQIKPQNREQESLTKDAQNPQNLQSNPEQEKTKEMIRIQTQNLNSTYMERSLYQSRRLKALKEQERLQKFQNQAQKDQEQSPSTFYQPQICDTDIANLKLSTKKQRPRRIEDLEEEKKANKSNDSITYGSDGEIQHHYL